MNYKPFIWIIAFSFFFSCDKIKYYPDKEYHEVKTLILAHKAGGGEYSPYQENSFEAAKHGLSVVDGVETDLQISKDRTIWLAHSADLPDCGGSFYDCFPETSDNKIIRLDSCNGKTLNYSRLEDIFRFMADSCENKYLSLDVKAWMPCAVTSASVTGVMNVIADEIIRLTKKYNLQNHVMVESETATFLNYVKRKSSGIACYLTSFGDFERAMQLSLESGYDGISFKYLFIEELTSDHIQLLRKKGLKIQLWTVNTAEEISEALSINPDFIQTDNLDYFELLK